MATKFYQADKTIYLPRKKKLKEFLSAMFIAEKVPLSSLTYVFCSDGYLLEVNQRFLKHNYYTDIITFSLNEILEPVQGEIYISVDRVKENALSLKQSFQVELHRVVFHGALHLCGFQDKTQKQKLLMTKKENEYLRKYFTSAT